MSDQLKTLNRLIFICLISLARNVYAQECFQTITATTPNERFDLSSSGIVIDKQTKLVWSRCTAGKTLEGNSCVGTSAAKSWKKALEYAAEASLDNKTNWRIPNIKELNSLVESACTDLAINSFIFPDIDYNRYWTSTPRVSTSQRVWFVTFQGHSSRGFDYKNNEYSVLIVHDY